ncbi:hypothetical protein COV19_04915 [Candidatus Woesearchaeota archaeon CG10_big_fil_rev_8_21_14_0_10_44_13]|nr:MAG: hypothetical protein COV19_04915 [Candidatus Woesearchaeota archaeon CG10_big_fil_rev_8_21_14_0_10_44_13]
MELKINIEKKHFYILAALAVIIGAMVIVSATGGVQSHLWSEVGDGHLDDGSKGGIAGNNIVDVVDSTKEFDAPNKQCILSQTCPSGWLSGGYISFLSEYAQCQANFGFTPVLFFGSNWWWCAANLCCK